MHVGMSELCLEWNDLDAAADHLRQSDELGDKAGLAQNPYRWRVAKAQLRLAEGDGDGALALLQDAERVFVSEYYPLVRPIPAQAARIHAAQGPSARGRSLGARARIVGRRRPHLRAASTSTSPSPGCSWLRAPGPMTRARSSRRSRSSSDCWSPPKRAGGGGASSRSSSCRRWPTTTAPRPGRARARSSVP